MRKLIILLALFSSSSFAHSSYILNDPFTRIENHQKQILSQMQWEETLRGMENDKRWLDEINNRGRSGSLYN